MAVMGNGCGTSPPGLARRDFIMAMSGHERDIYCSLVWTSASAKPGGLGRRGPEFTGARQSNGVILRFFSEFPLIFCVIFRFRRFLCHLA